MEMIGAPVQEMVAETLLEWNIRDCWDGSEVVKLEGLDSGFDALGKGGRGCEAVVNVVRKRPGFKASKVRSMGWSDSVLCRWIEVWSDGVDLSMYSLGTNSCCGILTETMVI